MITPPASATQAVFRYPTQKIFPAAPPLRFYQSPTGSTGNRLFREQRKIFFGIRLTPGCALCSLRTCYAQSQNHDRQLRAREVRHVFGL